MKGPFLRGFGYGLLFIAPIAYFAERHRQSDDAVFLPGPTSGGHHQIERQCSACHTPLEGVDDKACRRCHGESLTARNDSHAAAKFDDPGKAVQLEILDARSCLTCHREHRAEGRVRGSVSVSATFCMGCHAEVGRERPSHADFAPEGCASAGCHNYHDNQSLYRDLLTKHRSEPDLRPDPRVPTATSRPAGQAPAGLAALADVPASARRDVDLRLATREWGDSAHAHGNVACSGCHQPSSTARPGETAETGRGQAGSPPAPWRWEVADAVCASCHAGQRAGFVAGKHGMRLDVGLTAMSPALARAPMKADVRGRTLGCTSCHGAHRFNRTAAAVDACEGCHADEHTRAYRASTHFEAWQKELRGEAPAGSGVSCATCHLPRASSGSAGALQVHVQHNQNANLRPNDRMLRDVCGKCHGLPLSLRSLADPDLVARNFRGRPSAVATSLDLIEKGDGNGK